MDISKTEQNERKPVIVFEQAHLPEVQEFLLETAREIMKKERVIIHNPNVFDATCVVYNAQKIVIPDTLGKERIALIRDTYKKNVKDIDVEILAIPKAAGDLEVLSVAKLKEYAEGKGIDLTGLRTKAEILEAITTAEQ